MNTTEALEALLTRRRRDYLETDGLTRTNVPALNHGVGLKEQCRDIARDEAFTAYGPDEDLLDLGALVLHLMIDDMPLPTDGLRCPTCSSPSLHLHPAAGDGGEVTALCPDPFHVREGSRD